MKKKLLITGSTFPRYQNDTEPRFILDLAKALNQYADVTVLVPADPHARTEEILENVKVKRYHYFPIHSLETLCYPGAIFSRIKQKKARGLLVPWLFLSLYHQLKKNAKQYDLVLSNWLIPQGIVSSYVPGVPYYLVGHGGDITSLNKGIFRKLKIRCLKKASGVVTVSEPLMQIAKDLYPNQHTAVISMGCDMQMFGERYRQEQYFDQGNRSVILFAGRLVEIKGVQYLIKAMQYIPNALLIVVGDGSQREELERLAKSCYGSDDVVRFLGAKTHDELRYIYASSDVFVMPSITLESGQKEGFGLVGLEALASGLPVVASDSGGISSLIKDEYNGFLVEEKDEKAIANRVNMLLRDHTCYQEISMHAKETAKQYDYTVIAQIFAAFMGLD